MRSWALVSIGIAACGPGLLCGKGTTEVDGECVADPASGGDEVGDDDSPGDDDDDDDDDGTPTPGPRLVLDPETVDLVDVAVPCEQTFPVALTNAGDADLTVSDIALDSPEGWLWLDLHTVPALPLTLAPGDSVSVPVHFAPGSEGSDAGELVVVSNDPRGTTTAALSGTGVWDHEVVDVFEATLPQADVLLLIDQSCSMEDDNVDDVSNGIPAFVAALDAAADWQLIQVTALNACGTGGILDPSVPNVAQLMIDHAFDDPLNPLTESLLELASSSLAKTAAGECNEGFLRPGAQLHVIVISDEREQSGVVWTSHLSDYQSYVPEVVVSAVIDVNLACGDGSGAAGYVEAANATGGVVLNICNANWGADMDTLTTAIADDATRTLALTENAIPETVEVQVNGVPTASWTFDLVTGDVTITDVAPGATIEVSYAVAADCSQP